MPIFEITGDDIASLDDEKLRELVGRLCEAELRKRGLSPTHLTWGGDQNAADGGIDVRVALPANTAIDGFIPRAATGFQVKQEDTPASKISREMCPKNTLRPSIRELASQDGAYVIVSSQGSTADTALTSRRKAMRTAVEGAPGADRLLLDFYDRNKIATWVRTHGALVLWLRDRIGKSIPGWQSYGLWANPTESLSDHYIIDEKARLYRNGNRTCTGISAKVGLHELRELLIVPRGVVRLVGLSGVGKTRFVQALFDHRLGDDYLDPAIAIYTNMADSPDPQPVALASNLIARNTRAILIIDNCAADLHNRLSEVCRQVQSTVSLITIEYDIRDDHPEGTEVFKLDVSSNDLIETLLQSRYSAISQVDTRRIAEFSGGNARIALALAAQLHRSDTVVGLNDEQLFRRLFIQRQADDHSLYLAAQACSLVYSFLGEEDAPHCTHSEMTRLGALVGMTAQELFRHVAEMRRRDLVQQRGVWRAVLPHAVANRLAAIALENIPYATIDHNLLADRPERLMKSFARRLGYLHSSKEAFTIATRWLDRGGLLEDVSAFGDVEQTMLRSIAPVASEAVLAALERHCVQHPIACEPYIDLLRSLAYEPEYFDRCTKVLVSIISSAADNECRHGRAAFSSLFHLCFSGTHAPIDQRLRVLTALLGSATAQIRTLGVLGLREVLESYHFTPASEFDFGARSRDSGYWPNTIDEVRHWFTSGLDVVEAFADEDNPAAVEVRAALAAKFRNLWSYGEVGARLATLCQKISATRFWPEGWLAVKETLHFDKAHMPEEMREQLSTIEHALRPKDLAERVRSIVLSPHNYRIDIGESDDDPSDISGRVGRVDALAQELGIAAAKDEATLQQLVPQLVGGGGRPFSFGEGLYAGSGEPKQLWNLLVAAFTATDKNRQNPEVLRGFLRGAHELDRAFADELLDQSVEHHALAPFYLRLQVAVPIDEKATNRLMRSLNRGKTPVSEFRHLSSGKATDTIPAPVLRDLVLAIAAVPTGYDIAIDILHMRLYSDTKSGKAIDPDLVATGCALLQQLRFTKNTADDYQLGEIVKHCLKGDQGVQVARKICSRLKASLKGYETYISQHNSLLLGLFLTQPVTTLDALYGGEPEKPDIGTELQRNSELDTWPLDAVPDGEVIRWCDERAERRYVALAGAIRSFALSKNGPQWTDLALQFLKRAPDPASILSRFTDRFIPLRGWKGSLVSIMEENATLLDQLEAFPSLGMAVEEQRDRVRLRIAEERRRETRRNRERDERFE